MNNSWSPQKAGSSEATEGRDLIEHLGHAVETQEGSCHSSRIKDSLALDVPSQS